MNRAGSPAPDAGQLDAPAPFEVTAVWKQVTPALAAELVELWGRTRAIPDPLVAQARARQAVCIARDAGGAVCGVGTAMVRVLPRLRQAMYFYRQYFAPEARGRKQTIPFFNRAREALCDYNAGLDSPESLGVLVELENTLLADNYSRAYEPAAESTFIGYSPRGLQLRVSYFPGARLPPPVSHARRNRRHP